MLAAEVTRLTLASVYAESSPDTAARIAPYLPEVFVGSAMAQVGMAAAKGEAPPQSALDRLRALARVAPLRPEPFLVHGAIALRSGDFERAEKLLLQARQLAPRSAAARILLADLWVAQGRIRDGFGELAALSRLVPKSSEQIAPALAQYAKNPGAAPELARMIEGNPRLKQPLLAALAADPSNLALILQLDRVGPAGAPGASPQWQRILLGALVQQGQYRRAYELWAQLSGQAGERPLLFNGNFQQLSAPPPFNWNLDSGRAGLAEPAGGRLRVLHYGRARSALASQLLLLPPGEYQLTAHVSGKVVPGALAWTIRCLPKGARLAQVEVPSARAMTAAFRVPADCAAQHLELTGFELEMPQDSDALIGPVAIRRSSR